ncbi:MAG: hypothetical protein ACRENS_02990 [Candidatus Eiseniibacteriota bacterium]
MRTEIFTGSHIPELLEQARDTLGVEAHVLSIKRVAGAGPLTYQLVASDAPAAAAPLNAAPAPRVMAGVDPRVIALVGPTGAGKTTTIAKLANHPEVFGRQRVGLICLDTYRVGAVEQSRIYADIARLPLAVAYDRADLDAALRRFNACDVVLIDTAGRGPHAQGDIQTTRRQLEFARTHEIHVVLPAGIHPARARRVLAEHQALGATHLLVSKLDEFADEHGLYRLGHEFGLPSRWAADGQEVPGDLRLIPAPSQAPAPRKRAPGRLPVAA